jgi:hypothetical protein
MIGNLLYLGSASFAFGISIMFFKSRDGILRKIWIFIFIAYGLGLLLRGFHLLLFPIDNILIALPMFISLGMGFFFIYFKYYKKQK